MLFYSEDNEKVTSSVLLSKYLNIEYLSSNGEFDKLKADDKIVAAYIDAVPDKDKILKIYYRMWDKYNEAGSNIVPIQIPCIEYCIIMALDNIKYDFKFKFKWIEVVLYCVKRGVTISKVYPPKSLGYHESFYSFEKQCKLVLNNSADELENYNTNEITNTKRNEMSWYLTDLYGMSTYDKCCWIATKLPAVSFKCKYPDIFKSVNIHDIATITFHNMNEWCKKFRRVKLPDKWWEYEDYTELYKIIDEQVKGE